MLRCCVFSLLLCASPVFAGHPGSVDLNPRQATPGLRLELSELLDNTTTNKRYRLRAVGFPREIIFSLFTKNFTASFSEVISDLRVNEVGNMVASKIGHPQRLEDIVLDPGPYPRGAAWDLAIASADRSVASFTRIIPYPIIARDKSCLLSLELLSPRGDRFLVTGTGFAPGVDLLSELAIEGRHEKKRHRVSVDGQLGPYVISHAAIGRERAARYSVKSSSCEVVIEYEWGEHALLRR